MQRRPVGVLGVDLRACARRARLVVGWLGGAGRIVWEQGAAPFSRRSFPIGVWPPKEAAWIGMMPTLLRAMSSAPAFISTSPVGSHQTVGRDWKK